MTILTISDMHIPFEHPDAFRFLSALKKKYKPKEVVCLGDEVDFHAISRHDHDPDGLSAGDELLSCLPKLQRLYKLFPRVKVCTSNHTARPLRQAYRFGIPSAFIRDYAQFLQAPAGWKWADRWIVDGIVFEHGEGFTGQNGALKAALGNMQSTVIGHIHSFAGVQWNANPRHLIFGMNAGCLIDKHSYAFAYGKQIKNKPLIGTGVIVDKVPMFVPMRLNSKGRWTGKL